MISTTFKNLALASILLSTTSQFAFADALPGPFYFSTTARAFLPYVGGGSDGSANSPSEHERRVANAMLRSLIGIECGLDPRVREIYSQYPDFNENGVYAVNVTPSISHNPQSKLIEVAATASCQVNFRVRQDGY